MRKTSAIAAFLVVASSVTCRASEPNARPSGLYTNLHYIEEGGDLLGMELLVVPSGQGWSVFVQISEGDAPYTALVPLKVDGTKIEFTLPSDGSYPSEHFSGVLYPNKIVLRWSQGQMETLRRGKSYWE